MSGGDLRVLRREAGQESPRMPAWKREILERRKAKGGAAGAGASEPCSGATASRVNGEVTGDSGDSKNKDSITGANTSRNYTVNTARHHFAVKRGSTTASPELSPVKTKKDPWATVDQRESTSSEKTDSDHGEQERLVLQDSLGPLQENPFIKLEKERKKRHDRDNVSRPVQHILELYGNVPGIRTIRAENIIIIESDPDYFPEAGSGKTGSRVQQNGTVGSYSSLNDLIDRRGSAVTEIRAKEVVIYDSSLSKSEENLSTLGRPGSDMTAGLGVGQGRVSRMLQKFDRNFGKLQPKSHSTENLLDLETPSIRPRPQISAKPDLVPKSEVPHQSASVTHSPERSQSPSVFQSPQSSKTTSQSSSDEQEGIGHSDGSPSVSSFRQRFEVPGGRDMPANPSDGKDRTPAKLPREPDELSSKPKVPCSPEKPCPRAELPASCSPPPSPPSPGFEFRLAPRPDLSALPPGDIQARALANLRLQSRNSFTVIPRRRGPIASPGSTAPSSPVRSPPSPTPPQDYVAAVTLAAVPTTPLSPAKKSEGATRQAKTDPPKPELPACPSPPPGPELEPPAQPAETDQLPVTNIDDVEVEPSQVVPSPVVHRRSPNTFTVVPKRRPEPGSQELQDPAAGAPASTTSQQAPYTQLGSLLKKRYPAAEEIEVIGGYLSLGRSCLSKTGSTGKKLKISFNELSLHSTFEYPSESSLWGDDDDDEEKEEEEEEEEEAAKAERISIPRPSYSISPTQGSSSTADLSSYTPHGVDFSSWQEQKLDDPTFLSNPESREPSAEDVMLTPADSTSLSDFSSEPALYF
ncbi:taperin isoform X1 [Paramormyrops kingsleyae]|uniref:taperin isoform X1 n=1 Tax=Paramormyrops kingsleyae TaxID=1676925 RepID=UPI003B977AF0